MGITLQQATHTRTEDAITASIVQAQGQVSLTADNNIITTVANVDDAVTLKSVFSGSFQRVVNVGANALQIFPAAGQDLGTGVNNSIVLNTGDHIEFIGLSDNTWRDLTPTAIGTGFGNLNGPANSTDNAIAVFDGTTGNNIKNSPVIVDADGVIDLRGVIFENQSGGPRPVLFSSDIANETLTLIGNIGLTGFIKTDIGNFATSGFLRMNAADKIAWRNNANTGDLLLSIDISNNLLFNGLELLTTGTGLSNPLAVDLDFDGNDALKVGFIGSNATPVAGTGFLRMGKTEVISWRNNAGLADVSLSIDASDRLLFEGVELATVAGALTNPLTIDLDFDGNNALKLGFVSSNFIPVANAGFIRMGNGEQVSWRNGANTNDIGILVSGGDKLFFNFNGSTSYTMSATVFDFIDKNLTNIGSLSIDNTSNGPDPILSSADAVEQTLRLAGNFELTGHIQSTVGNVPEQGFLRMNVDDNIVWRNQNNDDDLILSIDIFDVLTFAGAEVITSPLTDDLVFSGKNIITVGSISSNVTPVAGTGFIRMAVTDNITWRNNGGTGDLSLSVNNSDKLVFNGIEILTSVTGLTSPLISDLNFDSNNALKVGFITSSVSLVAGTGYLRMGRLETVSWRNTAANGDLLLSIDGLDKLVFNGAELLTSLLSDDLDFGGNNATGIDSIVCRSITMQNFGTGEDPLIVSNSVDQVLDIGGDLLVTGSYISSSLKIATSGKIRLANNIDLLSWRNANDNENISLFADNLNFLTVTGGRGINLEDQHIIRWDTEDKRRITNDINGFIFTGDTGDSFDYKIEEVEEYRFNATQADFFGNNLRNVGFYESNAATASAIGAIRLGNNETIGWRNGQNNDNATFSYIDTDQFVLSESNRAVQLKLDANRTNPLPNDIVSQILFTDNNSIGSARTYAQIFTLIENSTDGSERGSMALAVGDGLSTTSFIVLNEGDRDSIVIKKSLDLQKINAAPPDPPLEEGRLFVSTVDADNNALFVKIKKAGVITEVKIG